MKVKEAKEIVECILEWQFVLMGVTDRKDISNTIDLSKYSLSDLIKANALVKASNKRKEKLAEYHRLKGHKVNGRSVSMILADRVIAAAYTAMSFTPNGEMIAIINDVGVGCVKVNYSDPD